MSIQLHPLFGQIDGDCSNLVRVGVLPNKARVIEGAAIWGSSGLVQDAKGEPLADLIWSLENLRNCPDPGNWRRHLPVRKKGDWYSTMLYWGNGYYHWICDVLPRILRDLPSLPASTRFIVSENLRPWQLRSLELIGVDLGRCVPFVGKRPWIVQRLHHSSPLAMTGDHDPAGVQNLRNAILRSLHLTTQPEAENNPRRIYISRALGTERHIENEIEVLPILKKYGIVVVRCEDLTFDAQVKTFHQSGLVIGPHGAGLSNMLWCQKTTKVFEIFASDSIRRCFKTLADALGLDYFCAVAENGRKIGASSSMRVNPHDLDGALRQVVDQEQSPAK